MAASRAAAYQAQVAQQNAQLAEYNATVNRNNALVAEQQEQRSIAVGQQKAAMESQKKAAALARLRAAQGASGLDVNTGSALDVQVGSRELGMLDTETVMNDAELEAYGYRSKAAAFRRQADIDKFTADTYRVGGAFSSGRAGSAETAGYLNAAGTLASNASSLPWKWLGGTGSGSPETTDAGRW